MSLHNHCWRALQEPQYYTQSAIAKTRVGYVEAYLGRWWGGVTGKGYECIFKRIRGQWEKKKATVY